MSSIKSVKKTVKKTKPVSRMTKAEKVVVIAQDVIRMINAKKFKVLDSHGYINVRIPATVKADEQLQKHLSKLQDCEVCALGACMLAKVDKFDDCKVRDLFGTGSDISDNGVDSFGFEETNRDSITEQLRGIFDENQMSLIEDAFESSDYQYDLEELTYSRAYEIFGSYYEDSSDRLKAIMKNIIDNNGVFKPEQILKKVAKEKCKEFVAKFE